MTCSLLARSPLAVRVRQVEPAPRISAGGATFVDPIMQKWSGEYKKAKNVEIDYVAKGSGYGISNVTSQERSTSAARTRR